MRSYGITEAKMKISVTAFMAASAVLLFCGAARAGATAEPSRKAAAVTAVIQTQLSAQTTAQALTPCLEPCDFDALSTVNDPLYREGSKEFLKQVSGSAEGKPAAAGTAKPVLRDAPNSSPAVKAAPAAVPHPAIKKPAGKKHGPADPVVIKNTL